MNTLTSTVPHFGVKPVVSSLPDDIRSKLLTASLAAGWDIIILNLLFLHYFPT